MRLSPGLAFRWLIRRPSAPFRGESCASSGFAAPSQRGAKRYPTLLCVRRSHDGLRRQERVPVHAGRTATTGTAHLSALAG